MAAARASSGIGMTSQRTRDRLVRRLREKGIQSEAVLRAIGAIARHQFVDEALASRAYEDTALPIGRSQTISQPMVVAMMTQAALSAGPLRTVLEVGTGSGYQAAVLSQVAEQVFTVERIDELSRQARRRFRSLGLRNIRAKQSDGMDGWPQNAPYDAVVVTAGTAEIPEALFDQVADGGVLVAPVGNRSTQRLLIYRRHGGHFESQDLGGVVFVPLLPGVD